MGRPRRNIETSSWSTTLIKFLPDQLVTSEVERIAILPGTSAQPEKVYYCNLCGKEFESAQAMGGHMNTNTHQLERAAIKERAKMIAIYEEIKEMKAMEDRKKRVANLMVERAMREAIEDEKKGEAVLKQRAESRKAKEELKAAFKPPQEPIHNFVELLGLVPLETTHFYSPNHQPFPGSSSGSIQIDLNANKRKRSNEYHELELRLGL